MTDVNGNDIKLETAEERLIVLGECGRISGREVVEVVTNPDVIKKFLREQNSKTNYLVVPIVCQIKDQYYCSIHTRAADYHAGIYDFKFEIPGKESIVVPRVKRFEFFFPKTVYQRRINPGHGYMYFNLPFEKVIEESDLDDFFLLLYQEAEDFSVTAYIYKDFDLLYKIRNIDYIWYDKYNFDPNNFRIVCNGKLWFMLDGTEIQACDLSCSFEEWCNLFGENLLLSQYALQNIDAAKIQWNSQRIVTWRCNQGHTWEKSICDYTSSCPIHIKCPRCADEKHNKFLQRKQALTKSAEQILIKYKTNSIEDALRLATDDLKVAFKIAKSDQVWNEKDSTWPKSVKFLFPFPNGSHGDIDMFLAQEYGVVNHIDGLIYEGEISTDHYDVILLLSQSMGVNGELVSDAIESSTKVSQVKSVLPALSHFLELANTRFVLRKQQRIADTLGYQLGRSIGHAYDYRLFKDINEVLRLYRAHIRKQRREVYANLASKGKTSAKWKSEQQAYAIIKSIYSDAIYQYKPDWLGNQSLDIFIPSLSVGIEYQGQQHFEVVSLFGGEERLQEQQQRDKKKRNLCAQNNVRLIEWKYNEPLKKEFILNKIKQTY